MLSAKNDVASDVASDSRFEVRGLHVYFKLQVFFYTLTKALGQRFDIFSFPHLDLLSPEIIVVLQTEFLLQLYYYLLSLMCPILNL